MCRGGLCLSPLISEVFPISYGNSGPEIAHTSILVFLVPFEKERLKKFKLLAIKFPFSLAKCFSELLKSPDILLGLNGKNGLIGAFTPINFIEYKLSKKVFKNGLKNARCETPLSKYHLWIIFDPIFAQVLSNKNDFGTNL